MSSYFTDLNGIVSTGLETAVSVAQHSTSKKAGKDLQMEDFLQLMVATFQNQTIDNQADISDMMNQMVQMSVVQAITNISTLITESTNLSYAASLVGKDVIVAQQHGRETEQITGTVTGTGTLNGSPVIFMGDKSYWLSDVLAVGQVPSEEAQAENAQAVKDAEQLYREQTAAAAMDLTARETLNAVQSTDTPVETLEDAAQQIGVQ
jgi:flagellar basal-body rod modification protein FlgD